MFQNQNALNVTFTMSDDHSILRSISYVLHIYFLLLFYTVFMAHFLLKDEEPVHISNEQFPFPASGMHQSLYPYMHSEGLSLLPKKPSLPHCK